MQLDEEGELTTDPMFSVPHLGTVADREDPEKLGRVRLLVPGIYQVPSPWAWPLGTLGGGSAQRGGWFVPEKGADVMVFFALGSHERPHFLAAHWGKPAGTSEAPSFLDDVDKEDAPDVRVIETKNWLIVMDDRNDSQLIIKDKNNSDGVIRIADGKIYGGDENASEPFVLGSQWKTGMEAILDAIVAITHSTAVGPTSPPLNAPAFVAQRALLSAKLSSIIYGK